ncbi:aldehyde dehydrogenase family protein [Arthrobacter sp. I2-34]|uniref:Aldehyde dehydrogenase family protein n=1 Tax=Arthrobacter hankyongi TaxID=2904801 RepID=A0ABS9L9U9_9MICC|nr:aldehyde dehydrogenase family protein [Arthrobacter hankyongi]MCG2623440.1 aldehyde dehydrogenase family protein [Arthrobacter hankyongi]
MTTTVSVTTATSTIYRPSTGEAYDAVPVTSLGELDEVFARARAGFEAWKKVSGTEKAKLLFKLADRLEELVEEFARIEARNTGKAIRETRAEAIRMPGTVRYWAGWADKLLGTSIPVGPDFHTYTVREPYGVVAGIVPWNVPYAFATRRVAPVIAMGNVVVLKPAEETPLTALKLAEVCREVGIPDGVVQVVTGAGDVGAAMVSHPQTDLVLFTGFHETGKIIARAAADNLTPTIQELGGKSPNIVFEDADIEEALDAAMVSVFSSTGQMCFAGSRLLVQESIHDDFVARLADRVKALKVGDPEEEDTKVGPHVTARQRDKTLQMIQAGIDEGAVVAAQSELPGGELAGGFFAPPTIFTNVTPDMTIVQEEIFGPVMSVFKFKDEAEALQIANDTKFGLAAGVWTSDLSRAHRMAQGIHAGRIWVNTYRVINDMVPGGGYGQSGYGAEGGTETLNALTRSKSVQIALNPGLIPGQPRI